MFVSQSDLLSFLSIDLNNFWMLRVVTFFFRRVVVLIVSILIERHFPNVLVFKQQLSSQVFNAKRLLVFFVYFSVESAFDVLLVLFYFFLCTMLFKYWGIIIKELSHTIVV